MPAPGWVAAMGGALARHPIVAARIDDPHLPALGDVLHRMSVARQCDVVPVAHQRIDADKQQQLYRIVIGSVAQAGKIADQRGDQRLGRSVDGQRRELGWRSNPFQEGFSHAVTRCIHPQPAAHEHTDRSRAMLVYGVTQAAREIVQSRAPVRRTRFRPASHAGLQYSIFMMMEGADRPTFGTGVTLAERVFAIALDRQDLPILDRYVQAAQNGADAAECLVCLGHRSLLPAG